MVFWLRFATNMDSFEQKNGGNELFYVHCPSFCRVRLLLLWLDFVANFLEGCDELFVFRF